MIICGKADVIPDGRLVLPKAICNIARLPYITIWVEQGDLDGAIQPKPRCDESAIWYFSWQMPFSRYLCTCKSAFRRVCFGRAAGGTTDPARKIT